ncbi:MAG TPA: cytochrome c3 family protein [Vicinamibacterales bacterium]|nr:cytochrome c3 family protein [Vicinamibacterales bacterium]
MRSALVVSALILAGSLGCRMLDTTPQPSASSTPALPGQSSGVFTTARASVGEALSDFVGSHEKTPEQPVEFPHNVHFGKKIGCTEYCHESVTTGPVAGLPSVRTCMVCHNAIAVDRARIKQITAMRDRGEDFVWRRVFDYTPQAHVKFNHAPHIRANVNCTTCHGPIHEGTVASRNVDLNMGFCVNCHNERKAPVDCLTCHF